MAETETASNLPGDEFGPNHLAAEEPPSEGQYEMGPVRLAAISMFWLGANMQWAPLLIILMPTEVGHMVGHGKSFALGLLFGLAATMAIIVPLIAGPLSDRCTSRFGRRRPFMFAGVAMNLVGLAAMWHYAVEPRSDQIIFHFPVTYWGFFVGYLIVQVGNNIATAPYQGVIPDVVIPSQRGLASGYMGTMTQIGSALGLILVAIVFKGSEMPSYLTMMIALVIGLVLTAIGLKERVIEAPPAEPFSKTLRGLWIDPRKYPDFAWVWITRFLVMFAFYSIQPFVTYYLSDVTHVPHSKLAATAGEVFLLILVSAAITGLIGGRLSDKIGRKQIVYISNGIMALGAVMLVFCSTLMQAIIVGVFFGLGYGAYVSVDWALGTDVLPNKEEAGKDMAVWHIAMVAPQCLAGPVAGFLLTIRGFTVEHIPNSDDVFHYDRAGYMAAFGVAAVALTLGAVLLRNVKRVR